MKNKKLITALCGILLTSLLVLGACQLGSEEPPQKAITRPYISLHPQSASYYTGSGDGSYTDKELEVVIWDWDSDDGNLSYQWYTFTDINDYFKTGGTLIGGATGTAYTPPSGTMSAAVGGDRFYYYVIVTNNKSDAIGDTVASIQSEAAVIAFSNTGTALAPIISRHPANASYSWGTTLNPLRVEASVPAGILSYQWYLSNGENFSAEDAEAVNLANQAMYIPDPDTLDLGDNYSYVIVTNTASGNLPASTISVPARIVINPGRQAAPPRITEQPKDAYYVAGDTIKALTVDAISLDRGNISYQWFKNTKGEIEYTGEKDNQGNDIMVWGSGKTEALNSGGTLITGATNNTYTPDINIASDGGQNFYYYVEVTNTNDNVTGIKTSVTASRAVKVFVGETAAVTPNARFVIPDTSLAANRFQYIRGYGGMDVAWGNFPETYPEDTELMYDPDRMGYNILRIMIKPNYVDVEQTMRELVAGDRPHYYTNTKIVNKYNGYVAAAPWTPPKEWKSNNSINGGGNLIPSYYKLFANYLRSFSQHMYNNGAPIYTISISNEPNYVAGYDGCEWEPDEMRDFFLEVGHFTDGIRGYGGGKEIPFVLTMNGESANNPNINISALRNPQSKAAIDLLARHIYGERTVSMWNNYKADITRPDGSIMEVWMTEHNINSANATGYYNDSTWNYVWRFLNDVDLSMRINNECAFVWWASKRFYSMVGDGQFGTTNGAPLPRGWALTHYARYTIDTYRVNIIPQSGASPGTFADGTVIPNIDRGNSLVNKNMDDMDNLSARITAYESADGNSISVIVFTPTKTNGSDGYDFGTIEVAFPSGFTAQSITAHKSWGDRNDQIFQPDDSVTLNADRTAAYLTVGRGQILSAKFTR